MDGKKLFQVLIGIFIIVDMYGDLSADAAVSLTENEMTEIVGGAAEGYGGGRYAGATSISRAYDLVNQNLIKIRKPLGRRFYNRG